MRRSTIRATGKGVYDFILWSSFLWRRFLGMLRPRSHAAPEIKPRPPLFRAQGVLYSAAFHFDFFLLLSALFSESAASIA